MARALELEHLFFDFGGCIDAPGIHTRTLFWDAYRELGLQSAEQRASFQEAYTQADQRMMASGEAKAMGLREFNRHNSALIAEAIGVGADPAKSAGDQVTARMDEFLLRSRDCLVGLAREFPLSVISNFTGNLEVILKEYDLHPIFHSVTESFYVGCSKPDERIFRAALAKQKAPAARCLYVGDNPVNDIAPAKKLGMQAALIHVPGQKRECGADFYLEDLADLLSYIQSK